MEVTDVKSVGKSADIRVGTKPFFLIEIADYTVTGGIDASFTTDGIYNANDNGELVYALRQVITQLAQQI